MGKVLQRFVPVPVQSAEHGHQSGVGRAGYAGIAEGNPSPEKGVQQVRPGGEAALRHQLGVVDQHHRQSGKRGPEAVIRPHGRVKFLPVPAEIGVKAICVSRQAVHPAPEHHICPGRFPLLNQPVQQFVGTPGHHFHPDAGAVLELPDDGPVHLLLVGGVNHQASVLLRGIAGSLRLPVCTAGDAQGQAQHQGQHLND